MKKIKYTCPNIDKVIKIVREAIKDAENGCKYPENATIACEEIAFQLNGIEGLLEELRDSNIELRNWAEENEKLIEELENDKET